jgi:low affinity Fe/Cu permease
MRTIGKVLTYIGASTHRPTAFLIVTIYGVAWAVLGDLGWHGLATLATWYMTLFIQRAEHRDTQAIHAKLDELLRAEGRARNELANIDEQEPEQVERHRDEARAHQ